MQKILGKFIRYYSHSTALVVLMLMTLIVMGSRTMTDDRYSLREWLNGTVAANWEQNLKQKSPALRVLGNWFEDWRFYFFQEGKKGVLVGHDGWLFTTEEMVTDAISAEKTFNGNLVRMITQLEELDNRRIKVLIALIPDKSRMLARYLPNMAMSPHVQQRYDRIRQHLLMQGFFAPDMRISMRTAGVESMFMKTDTHWSPQGSAQVASSLRQEIMWRYGGLLGQSVFDRYGHEIMHHQGDLARFIPKAAARDLMSDEGEALIRPNIVMRTEEDDDLSALLFGEASEIALVGTSFSANNQWAFVDQLQWALQSSVQNFALEGRGIFQPMEDFLSDNYVRQNPPKLVIWEIPERYLSRTGGR